MHTPLWAVEGWLALAAISGGAVFRAVDRHGHVSAQGLHPDSVAAILKTAAARAGIAAANVAFERFPAVELGGRPSGQPLVEFANRVGAFGAVYSRADYLRGSRLPCPS